MTSPPIKTWSDTCDGATTCGTAAATMTGCAAGAAWCSGADVQPPSQSPSRTHTGRTNRIVSRRQRGGQLPRDALEAADADAAELEGRALLHGERDVAMGLVRGDRRLEDNRRLTVLCANCTQFRAADLDMDVIDARERGALRQLVLDAIGAD